MVNINKNPWSPEDEKEHFPSVMEWWCAITFFKTLEDNKKWSFKGSFAEWIEKNKKQGSVFNTTFFDLKKEKHYTCSSRSDSKRLETKKNELHVKYEDSTLKGLFPDYEMFFHDKKNNIQLNLKYHAESLPRWIAQDITGGWLPMGLGFYRYGFIPKCKAEGELILDDKKYSIEGKGYYEHVWGDIWYDNPTSNFTNIKKTIDIYAKLAGWWLKNHKPSIPESLKFATENNVFGYDWTWALFDNGWTVYYGNILFWLMKGPTMGTLIFSKDGENYEEFCNIKYKYNKIAYSENFDFYYPKEIELTAEKNDEKLHLIFKKTTKSREYISRFSDNKFWKCFVICEAPGKVEGYYIKDGKKTKLSGVCKIEPQRQISVIGHNSLQIDFLKPPDGVGVSFDFESHLLKKKIQTQLRLAPKPKISFSSKKIDEKKINKN